MGLDDLGLDELGLDDLGHGAWTVAQKYGFAGHIADSAGFVEELRSAP